MKSLIGYAVWAICWAVMLGYLRIIWFIYQHLGEVMFPTSFRE